eukprot:TRINITY_DN25360_c0_g1_i1.p1 TRINITY_DN25360_c0_g1~~TRINITY_DN25360_c0_g1_i1.p1  ORF type:complete len:569 (-),score=51.15 TRINITY_DN25360_c0_g1_i1:250-1956(-)
MFSRLSVYTKHLHVVLLALLGLVAWTSRIESSRVSPKHKRDPDEPVKRKGVLPAHFALFSERKCIFEHVRNYPILFDRWRRYECSGGATGSKSPGARGKGPSSEYCDTVLTTDDMIELLSARWQYEDLMAQYWSEKGAMRTKARKVLKTRGPEYEQWKVELSSVVKRMNDTGLSYDSVVEACQKGRSFQLYACVEEEARVSGGEEFSQFVRKYVDSRDFEMFTMPSRFDRGFTRFKERMAKTPPMKNNMRLQSGGMFNYDLFKARCKERVAEQNAKLYAAILEKFYVTEKNSSSGQCSESVSKICPAGTYPTTKMQVNPAKGARAATKVAVGTKVGFTVGFSVAAAFNLVPFLAGGAAGIVAGATFGFALPIPIVLAAIASFYFSLGPRECACFPYTCSTTYSIGVTSKRSYSGEPVCYLDGKKATNNPYALSLPLASTKCIRWKGTCRSMPCFPDDYINELPSKLGDTQLFGSVGRVQDGIYNCISTEKHFGMDLFTSYHLPDGTNFTNKRELELYQDLEVPFDEVLNFENRRKTRKPKDAKGLLYRHPLPSESGKRLSIIDLPDSV